MFRIRMAFPLPWLIHRYHAIAQIRCITFSAFLPFADSFIVFGIVDDVIHFAVFADYLFGKGFQHLLPGDVPNEVVALAHVNDRNRSPSLAELLSDTLANAMCTPCHDCYLILMFHYAHYLYL